LTKKIFCISSEKKGPVRLFVGGVHGREGRVTKPILRRMLAQNPPSTGLLVVVPSITQRHTKRISTLKDAYYRTGAGKRLLSIIDHYLPDFYVELHCYVKGGYASLTDSDRREKRGVPPLVELEEKVLIGSVSPYLLSRYTFDLCLILEVPCRERSGWNVVLKILDMLKNSDDRSEAIEKLRSIYPDKIDRAITLMNRWNRTYSPSGRDASSDLSNSCS